ncbi:MAG: hypothetical protein V1900_03375 [Candidatus Aenigmatarchaeota archaeon]
MKIREYFDLEMKSTVIHAVVGCIAGYISFLINQPNIGLIAAMALLIATTLSTKTLFKIKKELKWWFGNGIVVYLFLWIIVWTIFYTIRLRATLP